MNRLKRGSKGDLGFAIANVSGQQAVHRNRALHVALDLFDGRKLVWRFDESEGLFEFTLPRGVGAERVPLRFHARRIELDQVDGNLANSLASAPLGVCPVGSTHFAQHRSFAADIASQQVELVGWYKEGVTWLATLGWRVFDEQKLAVVLLAADSGAAGDQFFKSADSVNFVNHIVAALER